MVKERTNVKSVQHKTNKKGVTSRPAKKEAEFEGEDGRTVTWEKRVGGSEEKRDRTSPFLLKPLIPPSPAQGAKLNRIRAFNRSQMKGVYPDSLDMYLVPTHCGATYRSAGVQYSSAHCFLHDQGTKTEQEGGQKPAFFSNEPPLESFGPWLDGPSFCPSQDPRQEKRSSGAPPSTSSIAGRLRSRGNQNSGVLEGGKYPPRHTFGARG